MKLQTKSALAVAVLVLIIAAVWAWSKRSPAYDKIAPSKGQIIEAVYGLGKIKSNQRYEVKLGVISTLKSRFVKEGQSVSKGQKLIELESGAQFNAPFAGLITSLGFYEGETVPPNLTVVRLENLQDRYLELSLEQESALRIKPGQIAKISFESLRGQTLSGRVTTLFPKDDEFIVHISVPKLDEHILPGMTADVAIEIGTIEGLLIPFKAIRNGIVQVERHSSTQKVKVEVGLVDGLSAEIKGQPFQEGDLVLIPKDK